MRALGFRPGHRLRQHTMLLRQAGIAGVAGVVLGTLVIGISHLPPLWAPLAIIATLFPFIAIVLGDIRKILLAVIVLDVPFQIDIHFGNRPEAVATGSIGGLGVSVTTIALAGLYALWLADSLARRKTESPPALNHSLSLLAYLAFASLSLLVARDIELSLFELSLLAQMLLLYIYVASTIRTRQEVMYVVVMLLVGLVLESLIIVGLRIAGRSFSLIGLSGGIDQATPATGQYARVAGTIGSPNTAASYLSILLAIALSVLLTQDAGRHKPLAAIAFGSGTTALVLTLSRGGWVALILSVAILCYFSWRSGRLPARVPIAIAGMALVLLWLFYDALATRLFGSDSGAALSRVPLMMLALRMIVNSPFLGVGVNNFGLVIPQYATAALTNVFPYAVHNKYLLVWSETGIGGLLAFLWFLAATLRRGWRCWSLNDSFLSPLALGITAGVVGQMAHMFVDIFRSRAQVQLLWLVAGLITAMWRLNETSKRT